jgi:hypothetical protein
MRKKIKIENCNLEFDSNEEVLMYHWLQDAIREGWVEGFDFQPETFVLNDAVPIIKCSYSPLKRPPYFKTKERSVSLVGSYVYTPDFRINFTPDPEESGTRPILSRWFPDVFIGADGRDSCSCLVDTKGGFVGKNNSSGVTFGVKRAWLYSTQGVYVHKIVPRKLFKDTWVPEACKYTRVRKQPVKEFTKPTYRDITEAKEYMNQIDSFLQGD